MILGRYNSTRFSLKDDGWRRWFAWYPCWIYESQGTDIAWVWLCWIERKWLGFEGRWLRCKLGMHLPADDAG